MKAGDMILIGGAALATVRAIRTPAQLLQRLPAAAEIATAAAADGAELMAVITLHDAGPEEQTTSVIIRTATGWETMDGTPIEVIVQEPHC